MRNILISIVVTVIVGVGIELFKPKIQVFSEIISRKPFESTVITGILIIIGLLVTIP